ncbi:uncharacterized protein LOC143910427 [Arctopsyche grandis]|uniref:uncharacterized protein LOC143910427 n=1 Tax=Arctopsyche grandis TaxID=121162 RepID=UPI00406D9851
MVSVKLLALFSLLLFVNSLPLEKAGLSDLEVGVLGENDKLLFIIKNDLVPVPGLNTTSIKTGVISDYVNITYITTEEIGGYPDARSRIDDGGIGYSFVTVELIPGPSQGFSYIVNIYGTEFDVPANFTRKYETF